MLHQTVHFLKQLEQNNNKEWFHQHKDEYTEIKEWLENIVGEIILEISNYDHLLQFLTPKDCTYRQNRDIRFSPDKSPYKTWLAATFSTSKNGSNPSYYFQINADGSITIAGGQYMFEPKELALLRGEIDKNPIPLRDIITDPEFVRLFGGLDATSILSRPPKGYTKENPNLDLLLHKNIIGRKVFSASDIANDQELQLIILEHFRALHPLISYLRSIS